MSPPAPHKCFQSASFWRLYSFTLDLCGQMISAILHQVRICQHHQLWMLWCSACPAIPWKLILLQFDHDNEMGVQYFVDKISHLSCSSTSRRPMYAMSLGDTLSAVICCGVNNNNRFLIFIATSALHFVQKIHEFIPIWLCSEYSPRRQPFKSWYTW